MPSRAALFVICGALVAEVIGALALLFWVHHQYTIGMASGMAILRPISLLAVLGGFAGLAVYIVRR